MQESIRQAIIQADRVKLDKTYTMDQIHVLASREYYDRYNPEEWGPEDVMEACHTEALAWEYQMEKVKRHAENYGLGEDATRRLKQEVVDTLVTQLPTVATKREKASWERKQAIREKAHFNKKRKNRKREHMARESRKRNRR